MASAPLPAAACRSCSRVMPHILTLVIWVCRLKTRWHCTLRQAPLRIVGDMAQIQAIRCKGRRGELAFCASQPLAQPLRRVLALADIYETADDVAHHVMQEGVGGHIEDDGVALAPDVESREILHGRPGLALGRTK